MIPGPLKSKQARSPLMSNPDEKVTSQWFGKSGHDRMASTPIESSRVQAMPLNRAKRLRNLAAKVNSGEMSRLVPLVCAALALLVCVSCGRQATNAVAGEDDGATTGTANPVAEKTTTITVDPAKSVIVLGKVDSTEELSPSGKKWHERLLREAADELREHLKLISGVEIDVVSEIAPDDDRYVFNVGVVPLGVEGPFQLEEARWRVTPTATFFYGSERNGALFAVYDFLESQLGVRWIEPGERGIAFKHQSPLTLTVGEGEWTPALRKRSIRQGLRKDKRGEDSPKKRKRDQQVDDILQWRKRMRMGGSAPGGGHTFHTWWDKYGETHPEYFALVNGKRAPVKLKGRDWEQSRQWMKICVSNPEVVERLVSDWLPYKDHAKGRFISACVNDGTQNFCECERCKALDAPKEGEKFGDHLTDRYVRLANAVASEAKKHNPDVKVAFYAYMTTLWPPRKTKVDPDVVVHLVPYTDALDVATTEKMFAGWTDMGAKTFAFRPNYHCKYHKGILPMGFEKRMFDVFQLAFKKGIVSTDYDSLSNHWPVTGLADYVLAKAMSDPSKPFEHWEDEYCQGYGAAAEDVKKYFRHWRENVWEKRLAPNMELILQRGKGGDFYRGLMWSIGNGYKGPYKPEGCESYYAKEDFDVTDAILQEAATKDLTDLERERLNQLILANQHARLTYDTLCAAIPEKFEQAQRLIKFREKHKDDLNLQWGNVNWFERKYLDGRRGMGMDQVEVLGEYDHPWLPTTFTWRFKMDPDNKGLEERWQDLTWNQTQDWKGIRINVPWSNTYECPYQELKAKLKVYDGVGWYQDRVRVPEDMKGRRVYLYFGKVDDSCQVYVNGKLAGEHADQGGEKGMGPFDVRIDPFIDWDKDFQNVVVRVEDKEGPGGICAPVWLVSKKNGESLEETD